MTIFCTDHWGAPESVDGFGVLADVLAADVAVGRAQALERKEAVQRAGRLRKNRRAR